MKILKSKKGILMFIVIILLIFFCYNLNFRPIVRYEYSNYSWGSVYNGYVIYANGVIKEFDKVDKNRELKKSKISKEELKILKELIWLVEDKCEPPVNGGIFDVGTSKTEVYNFKLVRWILLSSGPNPIIKNNTNESIELQKYIELLYNKYI